MFSIFSFSISREIGFLARNTETKVVGRNYKTAYFLLYLVYLFFTLQLLTYSYALFEEDRQRRKHLQQGAFSKNNLQYLRFVFWYSTYENSFHSSPSSSINNSNLLFQSGLFLCFSPLPLFAIAAHYLTYLTPAATVGLLWARLDDLVNTSRAQLEQMAVLWASKGSTAAENSSLLPRPRQSFSEWLHAETAGPMLNAAHRLLRNAQSLYSGELVWNTAARPSSIQLAFYSALPVAVRTRILLLVIVLDAVLKGTVLIGVFLLTTLFALHCRVTTFSSLSSWLLAAGQLANLLLFTVAFVRFLQVMLLLVAGTLILSLVNVVTFRRQNDALRFRLLPSLRVQPLGLQNKNNLLWLGSHLMQYLQGHASLVVQIASINRSVLSRGLFTALLTNLPLNLYLIMYLTASSTQFSSPFFARTFFGCLWLGQTGLSQSMVLALTVANEHITSSRKSLLSVAIRLPVRLSFRLKLKLAGYAELLGGTGKGAISVGALGTLNRRTMVEFILLYAAYTMTLRQVFTHDS